MSLLRQLLVLLVVSATLYGGYVAYGRLMTAQTAGDDPAAPPIPPPPDERFVVPRRYFVRFDEGLALEVCDAEARSRGRLGSWWRDLGDVLPLPGGRSSLRLRLTLPSEDAADLYRALPPDVRFAFDLKPQEGS